jgi:hypothetical protein
MSNYVKVLICVRQRNDSAVRCVLDRPAAVWPDSWLSHSLIVLLYLSGFLCEDFALVCAKFSEEANAETVKQLQHIMTIYCEGCSNNLMVMFFYNSNETLKCILVTPHQDPTVC